MVQRPLDRYMCAIAFIVYEEEDLVPDDGSTQIAAKLVEPQRLLRRFKVIQRVESIVAEIFKYAAVVVVRAGLRDDVHLRAKRMASFRRVAAVGIINFLDAVYARACDARRLLAFCIQESIDVAAHRALAIERDIQAGKDILHPVDAALEESRGAHRSGGDFQEFTYIASVDGQVLDLI